MHIANEETHAKPGSAKTLKELWMDFTYDTLKLHELDPSKPKGR